MDLKSKNEEVKFIISRYDSYYEAVNNKGNVYLGVNTFTLAGVVAGYLSLDQTYHFGFGLNLLFILALASNLTAIALTLLAVKPFLSKKIDSPKGSLLFFGDIADYHVGDYDKKWNDLTEDLWHDDLKRQLFLLAKGLKRKFGFLNVATWFMGAVMICVVIFGIVILNLKSI